MAQFYFQKNLLRLTISMKILIVAATEFEIAPLYQQLKEQFTQVHPFHFQNSNLEVVLLITGVGMTATAFALGRMLHDEETFDWAINLGIAGAFNKKLHLGDVIQVVSEQFGDLGIEEADGQFTDMFELGLMNSYEFPFENNALKMSEDMELLPTAKGLTVNTVHGYSPNIETIQQKYSADIETMEGAAFFYACKMSNVKFLQLRAISNYVESRNRENWDLPLAIEKLNIAAWGLLQSIKT